jgi:hypothetical protein
MVCRRFKNDCLIAYCRQIISVPLHPRKLKKGYNQVTTLANRSASLKIDYNDIKTERLLKTAKKKILGRTGESRTKCLLLLRRQQTFPLIDDVITTVQHDVRVLYYKSGAKLVLFVWRWRIQNTVFQFQTKSNVLIQFMILNSTGLSPILSILREKFLLKLFGWVKK